MKKYAVTDSGAKVLSPEAHKKVQSALHKQGKTSAAKLDDSQRQEVSDSANE